MSDQEYVNPENGIDTPPVDYTQWQPTPAGNPVVPPAPGAPGVAPYTVPPTPQPVPGHAWNTNNIPPQYQPQPKQPGFFKKPLGNGMELFLGIAAIALTGIAALPAVFVILLKMQEKGMVDIFTGEEAIVKTREYARIAEVVLIALGLLAFIVFLVAGASVAVATGGV